MVAAHGHRDAWDDRVRHDESAIPEIETASRSLGVSDRVTCTAVLSLLRPSTDAIAAHLVHHTDLATEAGWRRLACFDHAVAER